MSCSAKYRMFAITAMTAIAGHAFAEEVWPTRAVRIVVGYPAGTSPDTLARLLAPPLAKALGKPVIVDNKPGAGGNIGVDTVSKATDGHTFGLTTNGPLTTSKQLYSKLPFDPSKDIKPLSLAATSPLVFVSDISLPATTLKEFVAWAKTQPDGVTFGSIGAGTGSHLTMELLARKTGTHVVHIPFQGYSQITTAIISHDVQSAFMAPSGALVQSKAGKLRILGVSSAHRSPLLPDVPTVTEAAGVPNFNAELWIAAFGPATMSAEVSHRLTKEINAILKTPDVRQKLVEQGWEARGESAEALVKRIDDDTRVWTQVIRQANVRIE